MLIQAARTIKSPKYIILLHSTNIRMLHSTFECYIQHSNVATFKGSFEWRTFIYALQGIHQYTPVHTGIHQYAPVYTGIGIDSTRPARLSMNKLATEY